MGNPNYINELIIYFIIVISVWPPISIVIGSIVGMLSAEALKDKKLPYAIAGGIGSALCGAYFIHLPSDSWIIAQIHTGGELQSLGIILFAEITSAIAVIAIYAIYQKYVS